MDEHGAFHEQGYEQACAALRGGEGRAAMARVGSRSSPDLVRLLRLLVERELTPAIVFSFSRKECEGAAMSAKRVDALPDEQLQAVRQVS